MYFKSFKSAIPEIETNATGEPDNKENFLRETEIFIS